MAVKADIKKFTEELKSRCGSSPPDVYSSPDVGTTWIGTVLAMKLGWVTFVTITAFTP